MEWKWKRETRLKDIFEILYLSSIVDTLFFSTLISRRSTMADRDEASEAVELTPLLRDQNAVEEGGDIWIETKKLWSIVGPAIFTRVSTYLFFLITQSFAGHLGELELAAISIVINIITGFSYGFLVYTNIYIRFLAYILIFNLLIAICMWKVLSNIDKSHFCSINSSRIFNIKQHLLEDKKWIH